MRPAVNVNDRNFIAFIDLFHVAAGADINNAVHTFCGERGNVNGFRLFLFVGVANKNRIAFRDDIAFNRTDNLREKLVGDVRHDNTYRLRALGAQPLGVDVDLVIVLLNHFEHTVFGLFGIAAVFVEHAGNRGNRHAGKLGDVDHRNLFVFHVFHSRRKVLKNPVKLSNRLLTMPVYSENSQKSICF